MVLRRQNADKNVYPSRTYAVQFFFFLDRNSVDHSKRNLSNLWELCLPICSCTLRFIKLRQVSSGIFIFLPSEREWEQKVEHSSHFLIFFSRPQKFFDKTCSVLQFLRVLLLLLLLLLLPLLPFWCNTKPSKARNFGWNRGFFHETCGSQL